MMMKQRTYFVNLIDVSSQFSDDDEAEEALYDLNPGLEQYGPVLPAGIEITLPELSAPAPAKVVNVWD